MQARLVLIDLASAIQAEGRHAVKDALCVPGHTRDAAHSPPHPTQYETAKVTDLVHAPKQTAVGQPRSIYCDTTAEAAAAICSPYLLLFRLPDALHVHVQVAEEQPPVEAQAPKQDAVVSA